MTAAWNKVKEAVDVVDKISAEKEQLLTNLNKSNG